ncbi:hypothetical protein BC941DRAFT_469104 [Chlamydoabsidia padenii]|nr:hypothetical protein BC941DRAFT_469104 [Chlamydoabsidia padenii]
MNIQGFWGLQVLPGKQYTQNVTVPFIITMASLTDKIQSNTRCSLIIKVDEEEFVVCSLIPEKLEQQILGLTLMEGEQVTFSVKGDNAVHLTGNYVFDDDTAKEDKRFTNEYTVDGTETSDSSSTHKEQDTSSPTEPSQTKRLMNSSPSPLPKRQKPASVDQQSLSACEDMQQQIQSILKTMGQTIQKIQQQQQQQQQPESSSSSPQTANERKPPLDVKPPQKANERKPSLDVKPPQKANERKPSLDVKPTGSKIRRLPNGLVVEDKKVGQGVAAKSGDQVALRYVGKLVNGKKFDSNVAGPPFRFTLGKGKVIRGWDIGVAGMKVGGERKLTIPSALAYRQRGMPPDIPPNATLVFDIKLVELN